MCQLCLTIGIEMTIELLHFVFEQMSRKDGGKKPGKDMNELKQELDIDDHKIPIEQLYQRLGTNPETVNVTHPVPNHPFFLDPTSNSAWIHNNS